VIGGGGGSGDLPLPHQALFKEINMATMKEILDVARKIYEKTECASVDCCGNFDGALEYAVGEMAQELANIQATADLANKHTFVGLNPLGDVVMHCDLCDTTYAKRVQSKTLEQLLDLKSAHKCERSSDGRA
jgi:hypothetical protein